MRKAQSVDGEPPDDWGSLAGQPAFPTDWKAPGGTYKYKGASLRDYFAATAIQGMALQAGLALPVADIARAAYELADAMLEERNKKR